MGPRMIRIGGYFSFESCFVPAAMSKRGITTDTAKPRRDRY